MATSGTYTYSLTAADIIKSAYEDLGAIQPGGTVSANASTLALTRLNMIAKQYQGVSDGFPGLKVHTRQRVTLMLAKGQQTYLVGPASTDARATTQLGRTILTASAALSATTLTIGSNTDATMYPGTTITMTAGDFIGIVLNDGTIHWTTISGTPAATATIVTGLASAAASGKYVYWFTSRAQRFPAMESAVLRVSGLQDTPLDVYTEVRQYEQGVVDKYSDGTPTCVLIEPLRTQTRVTLNSQPTDVTSQIVLTVLYPAENYDATTNDIAYPQEALRFLSWELAFALSPSVQRWTPQMEQNRKEAKAMYMTLNPENSAAYFQPNA